MEGFISWKNAIERFSTHELSDLHSESVRDLASFTNTSINFVLSEAAAQQQHVASRCSNWQSVPLNFKEDKEFSLEEIVIAKAIYGN